MSEEIRRGTSSAVSTTGTIDNPKCTCCNPANFLEPPTAENPNWVCPISGKQFAFDPGEGVARETSSQASQSARVENPDRQAVDDDDLMPRTPDRETRRSVDPTQDKFA